MTNSDDQAARADSPQGYQVPATRLPERNQASRKKRWIGINCFAFVVSCLLLPLFAIAMMFGLDGLHISLANSQHQLATGFVLLASVGLPIFTTIYLASMLQWVVTREIKWQSWSLKSATVGTSALLTSTLVMLLLPINSELFSLLTFGFTSCLISVVQWLELRKTIDQAWHWIVVTTLAWTTLGTLVIGFGLGQGLAPLSDW
ncbi:hypothetical protein [Herpetosiphon geysericola]|uniref:Uncharacterized protein n=1 Tax=Herpetosiphon geysericola TaxID=70996 RepID=A0A0P6Y7V7_9CHLR|nr:hypothetical protein [Herpetosiphon geysericola]KPL88900.1 hypothetical protein SE18_09545 [Herpetosiphon geysericola]